MQLKIFPLTSQPPLIRRAEVDRMWMDATPERFAYRCLPLNMANQYGWELLCPVDVAARRNGGAGADAIEIRATGAEHLLPESYFGSGVLTFRADALFRTEPGYNLWVTGPGNGIKDGIVPLSGLIETDWNPYSFTMNWRFTRPDVTVSFTVGEPFCTFFPMPRGLIEEVELVAGDLASEPELAAEYARWAASRTGFNAELKNEG